MKIKIYILSRGKFRHPKESWNTSFILDWDEGNQTVISLRSVCYIERKQLSKLRQPWPYLTFVYQSKQDLSPVNSVLDGFGRFLNDPDVIFLEKYILIFCGRVGLMVKTYWHRRLKQVEDLWFVSGSLPTTKSNV